MRVATCPTCNCRIVHPQELVKMGLLLALLGGVPKRGANGSIPLRGDIHLLLVGDPGMGKSQMLKVLWLLMMCPLNVVGLGWACC